MQHKCLGACPTQQSKETPKEIKNHGGGGEKAPTFPKHTCYTLTLTLTLTRIPVSQSTRIDEKQTHFSYNSIEFRRRNKHGARDKRPNNSAHRQEGRHDELAPLHGVYFSVVRKGYGKVGQRPLPLVLELQLYFEVGPLGNEGRGAGERATI